MLKTTRHFLELIRFSHTLFALPFAVLAAIMAWGMNALQFKLYNVAVEAHDKMQAATPLLGLLKGGDSKFGLLHIGGPPMKPMPAFHWNELVGILLCMVTARSFAMAWNRLADRKLDANNPRTAGRHIPAGKLSVLQVVAFVVVCAVAFIASTIIFLPNRLPLYLSVPVLVFLAGYSYAKRFTAFGHFWLGAALAFSPVAAWIAIRGQWVMNDISDLRPALLLGGAVLAWVAGFDIIYACQDYENDRAAGLHSVPVALGIRNALRLAAGCHLLTIILLACIPLVYPLFGWIFWVGVAAVAVLLIYEHLLVRPNDLSRVNAAFFNVNAIISLGLLAVGSLDVLVFHGRQ